MKLQPKDEYQAMLAACAPGCHNIRARKRANAIEFKAHGKQEVPQHWNKVLKLEKELSARQRNIVNRVLHVYASNLGAAEELGLPKRMQKLVNAHIDAYYVEMAIAHDRRMLANMY